MLPNIEVVSMNPVVHFEITASDVTRAKEFYKKTFSWSLDDVPDMEYTIVRTTEVDSKRMPKEPGMINGGMMKKNAKIKNPVITISVINLDESMQMIKKNGGKIIEDKQKVGDMGFSAYFQDTEGNVMGLFQPSVKMQ